MENHHGTDHRHSTGSPAQIPDLQMDVGRHIRQYRNALGLSQDALAERIFVTRQTISNWETGKSYPDLKSLVFMGRVFDVSLDLLVQGDLPKMKAHLQEEERNRFQRDSRRYGLLLALVVLIPLPLLRLLGLWGILPWACITGLALYQALGIERQKKALCIQTYREILSYMEGKPPAPAQDGQRKGKGLTQKILWAMGAGLVAGLITALMHTLLW